ncbi:hypothetical protein NEHOM01_0401 [Nematocida homosporus]|uniref:uncharacterized protein n=1 Tax=Nematocida homosporus TaxID=1912981 RepID=UPI002220F5E1|nr:uncharacterized protein NEHOM01_0401 [Nematocida homosporus]KAI5184799.1 hypothetical protein NEHOM01_0401 [Nematocida homosporus]
MTTFRAIVSPIKSGVFELVEEDGEKVLKTNDKHSYFCNVAKEVQDMPCIYAVGVDIDDVTDKIEEKVEDKEKTTDLENEQKRVIEIDGHKMTFEVLPFYLCQSIPKREIVEQSGGNPLSNYGLSLEFGSNAFSKRHKKSELMASVGTSLESYNESLYQTKRTQILPDQLLQQVEIVPPQHPNPTKPLDMYTPDCILGYDPSLLFQDIPTSVNLIDPAEYFNVSELVQPYLQKVWPRQQLELILIMDGLVRILTLQNKSSVANLCMKLTPIHSELIKRIVEALALKDLLTARQVSMSLREREIVFARIIVILLLLQNGEIIIGETMPILKLISAANVPRVMRALGCTTKASKNEPGKYLLTGVTKKKQ